MDASTKAAKKSPGAKRAAERSAPAEDALALLTKDHREVKEMFQAYDRLAASGAVDQDKSDLARKICMMLTVHATIEEEIFYPAAYEMLEDVDMLNEAAVEHASAKDLITQIEGSDSDDDALFDAKVKVLSEYIEHHVKEEENEMFPAVRKAGMDTAAVGEEMSTRKEELMSEMSDRPQRTATEARNTERRR